MTLDLRPLDAALNHLEASVGTVKSSVNDAASDVDTEARKLSSKLAIDLRLPNLTADLSNLEGVQAAQELCDRLLGFPGEMQNSQSDVIERISKFDEAVGRISELDEACEEMLEQRQAMLGVLREAMMSLVDQLEDDIDRLVSDAGDTLTESFTEHFSAAGQQAFSDIEDLLGDTFADCLNVAADSADKLESQVHEISDGFVGKCQKIMYDTVEDRARQLLEEKLAEVIEDLGFSQATSMMALQLNTTIASAAPSIAPALKAVSQVQKLLELAKL